MIRITTIQQNDLTVLQVEGRLDDQTSGELKALCQRLRHHGAGPLALDLTGITYVDQPAIRLLRRLQTRNVTLLNPSFFVATMLEKVP